MSFAEKVFAFYNCFRESIAWGDIELTISRRSGGMSPPDITILCLFYSGRGDLAIRIALSPEEINALSDNGLMTMAFAEAERVKLQLQDKLIGLPAMIREQQSLAI